MTSVRDEIAEAMLPLLSLSSLPTPLDLTCAADRVLSLPTIQAWRDAFDEGRYR